MTDSKKGNILVNIISILTAVFSLAVDIGFNVVGFSKLAPDVFTSIIFIGLGILNVCCVAIAWYNNSKKTYALFVAIVFFFDYSFLLASTHIQTTQMQSTEVVNINKDPLIAQWIKDKEDAEKDKNDWKNQYHEALHDSNMERINDHVTSDEQLIQAIQDKIDQRTELLLSPKKEKTAKLTSHDIMYAIPEAFVGKRYIDMLIFGATMLALQVMIAMSITNLKKNKKVKRRNKKEIIPAKKERKIKEVLA